MQYLSAEAVHELQPELDDLLSISREVIRGLANGAVTMAPRPTIETRAGVRFMAFPVILENEAVAGVKWLGTTPGHSTGGRGGSLIVLSGAADARPFVVMDAHWITAIRTAVVSLLAGQAMAKPDSRRIAFLACGEQARLHLELFTQFYGIAEVSAYSRSLQTAERFAERARTDFGCIADAHATIEACVEGADIVITSTPSPTGVPLRAEWLAPSSFCSLVDLGRSFAPETLKPGTFFVIDDIPQFSALSRDSKIASFNSVSPVRLADVLEHPGSVSRNGGFLLPTGLGAIDIRIAHEIFKLASA